MVTEITTILIQYLVNILIEVPLMGAELITETAGIHSAPVAYLAGIVTLAVISAATTLISTGIAHVRGTEYGTVSTGRIATESPINPSDTTKNGVDVTRNDEK